MLSYQKITHGQELCSNVINFVYEHSKLQKQESFHMQIPQAENTAKSCSCDQDNLSQSVIV